MSQYALALVVGCLFAFYNSELSDPFWSSYLPILLLLVYCGKHYRFVLIVLSAYLWANSVFTQQLNYRLDPDFDNRQVQMIAKIVDMPELAQGRIRLQLKPLSIKSITTKSLKNQPLTTDLIEAQVYTKKLPKLMRLNWYQDKIIPLPGEIWIFNAKLKSPRGSVNPYGFDYEKWMFVKGIDGLGYIRNKAMNKRLKPSSVWELNHWRYQLLMVIKRDCQGCANIGLIEALSIGVRHDIPREKLKLLQQSGTAHLLAISGLHIGLISALLFFIGRLLWKVAGYRTALNASEFASIFAISGAFIYAALAGFSLPTSRAILMISLMFIALLLRRRINLLHTLSLALIIILIVDPAAIGSPSLWLSILAILVIAFAQFNMPKKMSGWRSLLKIQIYFSILFIPVSGLIFEQLTPASLFANIIAIPAVSFAILPIILIACLFSAFSLTPAIALFKLSDSMLSALIEFLAFLLDSGFNSISPASLPIFLYLLCCFSIVLLLMPRGFPAKVMASLVVLVAILYQPAKLKSGEYRVVVFDVGMGTSVFIQTRQHSLVYDLGPGNRRGFSSANWGLIPLLNRQGIHAPDMIIVSHVDQDHSGGLYSLLNRFKAAEFLSGTPVMVVARFDLNITMATCHKYAPWQWDGVWFEFLGSPPDTSSSSNNRSCILSVSGHHKILLPGDIEADREAEILLKDTDQLEADVLIVPHHGSTTSSSRAFVERVSPGLAIFTLSHANRWGFPKAEVLARYQNQGTKIFRTDQHGAITLDSSKSGLTTSLARKDNPRIWR